MNTYRIAVIGLGYVGWPLAQELGKYFPTIGFDTDTAKIQRLSERLAKVYDNSHLTTGLSLAISVEDIADCNVFIVAVPTPVTAETPNLEYLLDATKMIARVLKKNDLVIYESTVYPGATEEICIPALETGSRLKISQDFRVGYTPERINPGTDDHKLTNTKKVIAGSCTKAIEQIDNIYSKIIIAGLHKVSSIKVAEATKILENVQRDVNIALINECADIFGRLNIDIEEALKAAETKWNFASYRPGLVGGHCIGVDTYYLAHRAKRAGCMPELVLAARRVNEEVPTRLAQKLIAQMIKLDAKIKNAKVLIMGLTFKENCEDLRNSKTVNLIQALERYGMEIDVYDPIADPVQAKLQHGIELVSEPRQDTYDVLIIAVAHRNFRDMGDQRIRRLGKKAAILFDLKYVFDEKSSDLRF